MKNRDRIYACSGCGLLVQNSESSAHLHCPRCQTNIVTPVRSIGYQLGLAIAALIMYFPAMTMPLLSFKLGSDIREGTMVSSLIYFNEQGYALISVVAFFTSMLAPLIFLLTSLYVLYMLYNQQKPRKMKLLFTILYKIREWVMIDVYVIAILVSIVKLTSTADVIYNIGLVSFVSLTVFIVMLSLNFSPNQLWKSYHLCR